MWRKVVDNGQQLGAISWGHEVLKYVMGEIMPTGDFAEGPKTWFDVDTVYMPVNVHQKHWVIAAIDLVGRQISIYDSSIASTTDSFMVEHLRCVSELLPSLLKEVGFYAHRSELYDSGVAFKTARVHDGVPQQHTSRGDCGVFICKYVEYLSMQREFDFGPADGIRLRRNMALSLWADQLV